MNYEGGAEVADYPLVSLEEARTRAAAIVSVVGLESDLGLEDRLIRELRAIMPDPAARALVQETGRLYFLLHDPSRDQEGKPVNAPALQRSLELAMSRPVDDPCWRDYQAIVAAIESRWAKASAEYRFRPFRSARRRLTRTKPDYLQLEALWLAPISEAQRHFVATWREA